MWPPAWRRLQRIPALVLALGAPPCQEPNPAFDHDTGSGGASDSDGTSTASLTTTTTTTGVGDSTGSDPTTGEPPGSTSLPPDPTTTATTTATTTGDPPGDGSSSTTDGPTAGAYPPCMEDEDPPCPRPYDQCYDVLLPEFSACSQTCANDDDCPQPDSGTAQAVCAGPSDDLCVLDCTGNARCPDGMSCEMVGGGNSRRCLWPA